MSLNLTSRIRAAGKLAVNKLQIIQQKESAIAKQQRRQLSQTMGSGKVATARIKAETVIASDIYVELLELLELYCELIVSRAGLLEPSLDKDQRLAEAVHSIIYAAPATDVKELNALRDLLCHIVNKEIVAEAIENAKELVPEQIVKRVKPEVPNDELVTLYLSEIAKAYQVNVPGIYEVEVKEESQEDKTASDKPEGKAPSETDDLWARFNNLKR